MSPPEILGELLGWLFHFVTLAAACVCVFYRRLSPGLWMLAIAFAFQAVLSGVNQTLFLLMRQDVLSDNYLTLVYVFDGAVDLFAGMLCIGGLIWTFADLKRQLSLLRRINRSEQSRRWLPDDAAEGWQRPPRDSHDIQE
jgi:hypothetical protein